MIFFSALGGPLESRDKGRRSTVLHSVMSLLSMTTRPWLLTNIVPRAVVVWPCLGEREKCSSPLRCADAATTIMTVNCSLISLLCTVQPYSCLS